MFSLTDLAYYLRKFGPFVGIGFVVFLFFLVIFRLIFGFASQHPRQQALGEPAFGKINPINFSQSIAYPENPQFTIDNIEGRPIIASNSANVYYMPPGRTRLGYVQIIALMAQTVGFDTAVDQYALNETTARYENVTQRLDIDITNFNFTYEMNFENIPNLFDGAYVPPEDQIRETAKTFLRQMNKYSDDLPAGSENVIYLRYDSASRQMQVVDKPEDANVMEVSFNRPDLDVYPMVPPSFFKSQNYVILVFKENGYQVVKAQIKHFPYDPNGSAYPLITGDQAWQELLAGKGTIVSAGENTNQIIVRNMFLAYYNPDQYQEYLQPVFVFLGDNNFAAYVPAVSPAYLK